MNAFTRSDLTGMTVAAIDEATAKILKQEKVGRSSDKESAIKRYLRSLDKADERRPRARRAAVVDPSGFKPFPDVCPILDRKVFTLLYDPEVTGSAKAELQRKLMKFEQLGRDVLDLWFKHGKKTMTGLEIREFLEKHRESHFARVRRPMMRAFQDLMTVYGDGPKGNRLVKREYPGV